MSEIMNIIRKKKANIIRRDGNEPNTLIISHLLVEDIMTEILEDGYFNSSTDSLIIMIKTQIPVEHIIRTGNIEGLEKAFILTYIDDRDWI